MRDFRDETFDLLQLITSGADERSQIHSATGKNKYQINPVDYQGHLCRGSCTCNTLNEISEPAVRHTYQLYQNKGYESVLSMQLERLYRLFSQDYYNEYDILFAPSGSDLAYIPLLVAQALHPDKPICSIVTCPEELGSGSRMAMEGLFYNEVNQFGEAVPKGGKMLQEIDIELHSFPARDDKGEIITHDQQILGLMHKKDDTALLGHLVVGSKSGIEDNLDIIPMAPKDTIWTVDLCQMRNSSKLIHHLLDQNCMIMLTGSKFYQAPPFCGVMLIPKAISEAVAAYRGTIDPGFARIFSRVNLPFSWSYLRTQFRPFENIGLLLRWEAAIAVMEEFDKIPWKTSSAVITHWHSFIRSEINKWAEIELMPHQEYTNNSIISFRLRNEERYYTYEELKDIYIQICDSSFDGLTKDYQHFTIGQPVHYGNRAFLRIALGAYDAMQLMKHQTYQNDVFIIRQIAKYCHEYAGYAKP